MAESTTIIAFDQHADSVVAAVLPPGAATATIQTLKADSPSISRFVTRVRAKGPVRCCYEAGPCGFSLQRYLTGQGIDCEIIAPSLIPQRTGVRVKTDRRDARQLAVLYRAGALTPIHIPSEDEEAVRDLLRCRETIQMDVVRARHRLSKFLLRHDRRYPPTARAWSLKHRRWLRDLTWPVAALHQAYTAYVRAVDEAEERLTTVERELQHFVTSDAWAERIQPLRCFRGISDLTALTIASELGDARRFATAPRLMAFVGLVPTEHSSGAHHGRGAITKTGNAHLRRVLVEAAWHYRHPPRVGRALRLRQQRASAAMIRRGWVAQSRLLKCFQRFQSRGRPHQVAVTAVARELTGFVWAALRNDPIG
jgi:transposase